MSPTMKISLLALISTAAAIPQYGHGGHNKFHSLKASQADESGSRGPAYPTGGWSGGYHNTTRVPQPTATSVYDDDDEKTTTFTRTITTTHYTQKTIYATRSSALPVTVEDVPTSAAAACGLTVTVTAPEKVTVTITPSVSASSASTTAGVSSVQSDYGYEIPSSSLVFVSSTSAAVSSKVVEVASSQVPEATTSQVAEVTSSKVEEYDVPTSSAIPVVQTPVVSSSSSVVSSAVASSIVVSSAAASSTVVSSAAPTATSSSPSYSGSKRGLAYNDPSLCKALGGSYGFAYNWGQVENNDIGTSFIPMMHRPSLSTAEEWLANVDKAVKAGGKAVMGFNEPDHASQANLTPDAACSAWKEYMNPIASSHSDVTIIGPSVTNGPAPMGLDWLDRFHSICPEAIVHATNIHFYDIPSDETITRFKTHIEKAASTYGKPVWVTEFGLNAGSATPEQATSFLKQAMEYMDGSDLVQGYAYFMVGAGDTMLNAGTLVGQAYASSA